jgi:phage/plasmid-like protein (TIGR03299 family)
MPANVQSMVSGRGQVPWHKVGTVVEGLLTASEALVQAGMNWSVSKEFIQTVGGRAVPNAFAVKRSDNNAILGVVGNQYTALQNQDAFSVMDSVLQDHGSMKYETAGVLGEGERVWIMAAVEGDIALKGKDGKATTDTLKRYILCANSHDGSSPVLFATTMVRVVCQNTLTAAIHSAEKLFKMRHTKGMTNKVPNVREALGVINKSYQALEEKMNALTKVKVTDKAFEGYIAKLGFDVDADKGKGKSTVASLKALFGGEGQGSTLVTAKGTAWGALNAVTEYVDHQRQTRVTSASSFKSEDEARLASQWFGSGLQMKEKALEEALALVA